MGDGTHTAPAPAAAVRADGVVKRWGAVTALSGVSFEIGQGVTGLLGPNGAGKTTLIELVLGLHRLDAGTLEVHGLDPQMAGPMVRAKLGYAPEYDCLPGDVRAFDIVRHMAEIHGIPRRIAPERASDALHLTGLGEERFRPLGTFSTGQKQRAKLAQSIVHDPDLVLLDEPTNGLDPIQRDEMLETIRTVARDLGTDVLLASHVLGEVERVCDAVIVLDAGRLVAAGSLDDLRGRGHEIAVEVDGDPARLARALKRNGARVRADGSWVFVAFARNATYDVVRDALASSRTPVRRLHRVTTSLEEVVLGTSDAGAPSASREGQSS